MWFSDGHTFVRLSVGWKTCRDGALFCCAAGMMAVISDSIPMTASAQSQGGSGVVSCDTKGGKDGCTSSYAPHPSGIVIKPSAHEPMHKRPEGGAKSAVNQAARKRGSEALIEAGVGSTATIVVGGSSQSPSSSEPLNQADEARLREKTIDAATRGQTTIILGDQANIQTVRQKTSTGNAADTKRLREAQIDAINRGFPIIVGIETFTGSPLFQQRRRMRGREAIDRAFAKRRDEAVISATDRGDNVIFLSSASGDDRRSADLVRLREAALKAIDRARGGTNVLFIR